MSRGRSGRGGCFAVLLLLLLTGFSVCCRRDGSGIGKPAAPSQAVTAELTEEAPEAVTVPEHAKMPEVSALVSEVPYYQPDDMAEELPRRFDRRDEYGRLNVKDQGELGTCWAFASLMALESTFPKNMRPDFSENHMSNNENFNLSRDEGGEYTMALAYLLSWQGPVLETEDPYGGSVSPGNLEAACHLQEAQFLPRKDYGAIKTAVYLRGGVQSSLYTRLRDAGSESLYYQRENAAYCYDGDAVSNHEVVIVGWDDDYPKENFSIPVAENGAFLCVNSWGTGFGDEGYFYVSYYDSNIGVHNVLYTRTEDQDNYDRIYQSDLCGWIGALGFGEEEAWAANVYQAGTRELLKAAGFYATGEHTRYELYLARQIGDIPDFSDRRLLAEGTVTYTGYYTIPVSYEVVLEQGERFALLMRLVTPGAVHPIAIEYDSGDGKSKIDLSDGEGYISLDGEGWESAEESQNCNLCLKAYTDRY